METTKLVTLLTSEDNMLLIDECMKKAVNDLPVVYHAGILVHQYHGDGQTNTSSECASESSLLIGQALIDELTKTKTKAKPRRRIVGENISEAYKILRAYFKGDLTD